MRTRIAASVALAAALALGVSGCTFISPQSTLKAYDPSDGVDATVANLDVRNALLLSNNGQEASFVVSFINNGDTPIDFTVQYTGTGGKVTSHFTVDGNAVKSFGDTEEKQLVLQGINTKAGALFPVFVTYGSHTGKQLLVPVLGTSWSQYKDLAPTKSPTPKPRPTNIPGLTESPMPTASSAPSN
ncbi:hypothetical protein [Lacisediminihabitans changchengi]|uniref:DNA modification methylase n=1 Tax=Lacisediminihabitans changchengi TaxID=2787634 RepID=A0A934SMH4_9MICO|nr:hypothetical protein [Lacisediminihabitans changchengi]MBK4348238.1 hypothetical protein [Lacisediminihabitans changchengi]